MRLVCSWLHIRGAIAPYTITPRHNAIPPHHNTSRHNIPHIRRHGNTPRHRVTRSTLSRRSRRIPGHTTRIIRIICIVCIVRSHFGSSCHGCHVLRSLYVLQVLSRTVLTTINPCRGVVWRNVLRHRSIRILQRCSNVKLC